MTTHADAPSRRNGLNRRMALTLLAGPLVWMLHLFVVYAVTSLTCEWGWFQFTIAGVAGLRFFHLVVTVMAAGLVLPAAASAFRRWRRRQRDAPQSALSSFAAFLGVLSNSLFLFVILVSLVPILTFEACVV